jgi:anti-sigma factor RsiW
MSTESRLIPESLLECYLVGSLDEKARAEVEAALVQSEADRARLAQLRAESAAFLRQHPPEPLVERFEALPRPQWEAFLAPRPAMSVGSRRIVDSLLECYLVGSLDKEARAEVTAVLAESEADRDRLAQLRAESAAFLVQHPPTPLVKRFEVSPRRWWRIPLVLLAPVLAAAAVLVVLLPAQEVSATAVGVSLSLYRDREEVAALVVQGETLAPDDSLRFEVRSEGRSGYVAVLSWDMEGTVAVAYPVEGEAAVPLDAKAPLLSGAIGLEGRKGEVEVYVLFSSEPFKLDWAVLALREGRELAIVAPKGVSVGRTSFLVRDSLSQVAKVSLTVHREHEGALSQVMPGEPLSPGDTLRFKIWAQGKSGYVAVLSRDAAGTVAVYHPFGGKAAAPFDAKAPLLPEEGVSAGWKEGEEQVYAFFSPAPFQLEPVVAALREGRDLTSVVTRNMAVGRTSFRVRDSHDRSLLVVYRERGETNVRVYPGERVSPDDTLRFEVRGVERSGYVAVLGRDAAGAIAVYYPFGRNVAVPFNAKAPLLPGTIGLEGREGEETVYALFSPNPFKVDWAVSALREGRELASIAPKGMVVGRTSFLVEDLQDSSSQEPSVVKRAFSLASRVPEVSLAMYRKRGEGMACVKPGETLEPGDTLRIEVRAGGKLGYVAVLSRDAAGFVTVTYPSGAEVAAPFDAKAPLLPGALTLREGKEEVEVYALFSKVPFKLDWAVSALQEDKGLVLVVPEWIAVGEFFFSVRGAQPMKGIPL